MNNKKCSCFKKPFISAVVFVLVTYDAKAMVLSVLEWTQGIGNWGPVVVALFYIVSCVLFLPGSVLTLGAGFLFKLGLGTVTVSIGSVLGASAAFWVGRTLARQWVSEKDIFNREIWSRYSPVRRG